MISLPIGGQLTGQVPVSFTLNIADDHYPLESASNLLAAISPKSPMFDLDAPLP